jgi:hypothetical protein
MSRRTGIVLIAVAIALVVAGLLAHVVALAVIGLFGGVAVGSVWALAAGGDWVRDVSERRFTRDGRS